MKPTQLDCINRIVYLWARYLGTRTKEGKEYSKREVSELIERMKLYRDNPEKFDYGTGDLCEEDD